MSVEGINLLIHQAENIENDQAEQVKQAAPDYQSAEEIREQCKQKAIWMVGGLEAVLTWLKPEATPHVLTDPVCNDGVKKITDVLVKYPGAELPPWIDKLLTYKAEFLLVGWMLKTGWSVHQVDQAIQEAKAEAEKEKDRDSDQGGADHG